MKETRRDGREQFEIQRSVLVGHGTELGPRPTWVAMSGPFQSLTNAQIFLGDLLGSEIVKREVVG